MAPRHGGRWVSRCVSLIVGVLLTGSAAGATESAAESWAAADTQLGQEVYRQYCASCHGVDAEGAPGWQKPNERGELPAPPHNSNGHTWRHADSELYEMIAKGWRDPFNKTDRLTMPAFEQILKPDEINAVIAYLKTPWTPEQRQFQLEKTQEMSPAGTN